MKLNCVSFIVEVDDESKKQKFENSIKKAAKNAQLQYEVKYVGESPAELNKAVGKSKGEIICFTQTSCIYTENVIRNVAKIFANKSEINIVSAMPVCYNKQKVVTFLHRSFEFSNHYNLNQQEYEWNQFLFSLFISKSLVERLKFNTELKYEYKRCYIADLYSLEQEYELIEDRVEVTAGTELDYYNYAPQYNLDWYFEELDTIARILLVDKNLLKHRILMDFIRIQYACNLNGRDKNLLVGDLLRTYENKVTAILQKLEDPIITDYKNEVRKPTLPRFTGMYFLRMKYGREDLPIEVVHDKDVLKLEGAIYDTAFSCMGNCVEDIERVLVSVKAMNYRNEMLEIDGELINMFFEYSGEYTVVAKFREQEHEVERNQIYSLTKMFGKTVKHGWTFKVAVPVENIKGKERICFYLKYRGEEYKLNMQFTKAQSRLFEEHKKSYWNFNGKTVKYLNKTRELTIQKSRWYKTIVNELVYDVAAIKFGDQKDRAIKSVLLRWIYYLTRPYYKNKNIWMTFDQLFKGGDNGEYFYRYVSELKNNQQKIYYVVNKNTNEYKELSQKYNTVLDYNCFKHKLITLHAKMILTTRADAILYGGYFYKTACYFRGLFNSEIVCLQHGLTIQQIAQYQNRLFDNLKYYFCVSKYEVDNISQPIYGYDDKSALKLTGAPRYDGLYGDAKKQIIITPTWRRNVTAGTNSKGSNHEYSVNFKRTAYYQIYNKLINDPKLIATARKYGYKLIYLIHPILSPQIGDFDTNDYVEIVPGSEVNYEKILTESALMLTDHSGIMYDFAYQRKPVIYYHPEELPPQYGEGGLKYDTMGFGPVCRTHEEIVDGLCKFIESDCKLEDEYKRRIEDFFEYDDLDNCKRVYEAAVSFQKGIKY